MFKIAVIGQQCAGKTSAAYHIGSRFFKAPGYVKHAQPIYAVNGVLDVDKNRAFMQQFGDLAKEYFGEYIFRDLFVMEVEALDAEGHHDGIVNDDTRFPFEMAVLQELGFESIFVDSPSEVRRARSEALGFEFIENHNSEIYVPQLKEHSSYIITDDGLALDELYDRCDEIMEHILRGGKT